jgi:predicted Zn-dependent protease
MYDLADAYVRAGRPQAAIPLLQARLQRFDNQNSTVEALLRKAQQQAGGTSSGPGNGNGQGKDKSQNGGGD